MKNRKNLNFLVYLAVFFIPFYLIKVKIGLFPINFLEIIIGVIFLVWFFGDRKKDDIKNFFYEYEKYIFFLGFIFFGLVMSTFLNRNHMQSLGIIKSWFLIPLVLFFLIEKIVDKRKISNIFTAYLLSASCVALISLMFFGLTYDKRLAGIFNSPNYLAMYLSPALIIITENQFFCRSKIKYFLIFICLASILIAFYLTYSYAAWFSVMFSFGILLLIKKEISIKKTLIAGVFFLMFFSQLNSSKMLNLISADSRSSLASRIMIWRSSVKILEDNFIFGIGPGNFQEKYLEYQKFYPPYLEWAVPHPNNLYLALWLSGGLAGFFAFFGIVILFFRDVLISLRIKKEPEQKIIIMALGIMLTILIHGIFDTTYFKNDLAIIFWLNFLVLKL